MTNVEITCVRDPKLDDFERELLFADTETKLLFLHFPANNGDVVRAALKTVLSSNLDNAELWKLLAQLGATVEKKKQYELYGFGASIEQLADKIAKPRFCRAWGSKAFVAELCKRGFAPNLMQQISTFYPLSCEGYLLAGLFSEFFGQISLVNTDVAIDLIVKIKNPSYFRLVEILVLRKKLLGCQSIRETLKKLGVEFTWSDVEEFNWITQFQHIVLDEDLIWSRLEENHHCTYLTIGTYEPDVFTAKQ